MKFDTKEVVKIYLLARKNTKAILENNVIPFYQPIFDRNKEIVKYETFDENKRYWWKWESDILYTKSIFICIF